MLKKIIMLSVASVLTVGMSVAQSTPVELTSAQMDNVNAGWGYHDFYHYDISSAAAAAAAAVAFGDNTSASTSTNTIAGQGISAAESASSASAHSTIHIMW